ncbi:MAG: hypothetical protein ACRCZS_12910 [Chroococcidiopsis sp.]
MKPPILPVFAPTKHQAIEICSKLIGQLQIGNKLNAPIGKYGNSICQAFHIPLAPGENALKVAFDKLIEWRSAISFNIVRAEEFERILPKLIEIYGKTEELGIRGAIASEVKTREQRKTSNKCRKPKEAYRRRQATAAPLFMPEDPYAD